MACSCGKGKAGKAFKVKLPGGMTISKSTESQAIAFAAKHPGSTVIKPAA
jgi:hypothetical protein